MEYMVGIPEREYQRALAEGVDLAPPARRVLVARPTRRIGRTLRQVLGSRDELLALRRWFERAGCAASVAALNRVLGAEDVEHRRAVGE